MEQKPRVGMQFDSAEAAWHFWIEYGGMVGFGVRKQYMNKKKDGSVTSCRFVCCKEGVRKVDKKDTMSTYHRLETRTNCNARITLVTWKGKLTVNEFVKAHNHPLQLPETTHMLASQQKISQVQGHEIEMAEDSGLQQKATFQLMSTHAGGRANLGFTRLDAKNYLRSKRQRSMIYGEVGCLLQYFQHQLLENPSFFHAYQVDSDEQITNVFWVDARMIIDYGYFDDVVSLDTTYCTNRAHRLLALFSGFNHYRQTIMFGAALLYDETAESFRWLFETFLEAHSQKRPLTIFTDQDAAMAKALGEVMPSTRHGLCTWHLMQNGIKHLGNLMKDGSNFLTELKRCMYSYVDEAQFEAAWLKMLSNFNVHNNSWLKSVYTIRAKWAACHMKHAFTLGMRSTQLSESLNSDFKACMKVNLDLRQFFKAYERVVAEKRYNELKCEFDARHKLLRLNYPQSSILNQLAKLYTLPIFDLFQEEFDLFFVTSIRHRNETFPVFEYTLFSAKQDGEWKVLFDHILKTISCSCMKFESFGILCSHALKVFIVMDVEQVPTQYLLKRWTKNARDGIVHDSKEKEVEVDPKLASSRRYKQLCSKMIILASEVSTCEKLHSMVEKELDDLCKRVMDIQSGQHMLNNYSHQTTTSMCENVGQAKGFKQRDGNKRQQRLKGWVECQGRKKRKPSTTNMEPSSQLQSKMSYSAPLACYDDHQTQGSQFSFTRFLMESLEVPVQSLDE